MSAIAPTKLLAKIVFIPMVAVSGIFTVKLFFDFGSDLLSGMLWSVVGLALEIAKILFLTRWSNQVYLNRKVKPVNAVLYLSLAFLSAIASVVWGISTVEKQAMSVESESTRLAEVVLKIKDAESRLKAIEGYDTDGERKSIDRQIDSLSFQIANITHDISERSIAITKEIERLQDRKRNLGRNADDEKSKIIATIGELKRERSSIMSVTQKTKGSFEVLANALGVATNTVMVAFLFFVVVAIEVVMAVTSGPAVDDVVNSKPPTKIAKKKHTDQLTLEGVKLK